MIKLYLLDGVYDFNEGLEAYPFVGEVDFMIGVCEVIAYNGNYYSVCVLDMVHNKAGVREVEDINLDEYADTYGELNVICPVCGHEDDASFELSADEDEYTCSQCGALLRYERNYSVTYNTSVIKLPEIKGYTKKGGEG